MTKKTAPSNQSDSFEKIPVQIFSDSKAGSAFVARQIADFIREKQKKKEKCVLGLATGSTPKSLYAELVRLHREEKLSFKNVITFNLDEYYPIDNHALQSYSRFMRSHLFDILIYYLKIFISPMVKSIKRTLKNIAVNTNK